MVRGVTREFTKTPVISAPPLRAAIHNRFDVEVVDANTGKVKQKAQGLNVICNQLWTRMMQPARYFNYIHYGTGEGTPDVADTKLFSFLGAIQVDTDSTSLSINYQTGIAYARRSIQLVASAHVGATLTEVGIGYDSGVSTLCTHAMLTDMNGNQVSITKSDTDVINIYATVYAHFDPNGFDNGSIRLHRSRYNTIFDLVCGIGSNLFQKAFFVQEYALSSVDGYRPKSWENQKIVTYTYDAANKKITGSIARVESSEFNFAGIRRVWIGNQSESWSGYDYGGLVLHFDPGGEWFPFTEITNEAVGTGDGSTVDFALDFIFARDAKVYIDGVETTDFTLDYGPHVTNAFDYLEWISTYSRPGNHIPYDWYAGSTFKGTRCFYNPAYEIGLKTLWIGANVTLYASNDMETWETVRAATTSNSIATIPEAYRTYKYWKGVASSDSNFVYSSSDTYNTFDTTFTNKKLHFTTPPAAGAVITADYKTDTIAKDANHVFDMSFEIQLGEYVEG